MHNTRRSFLKTSALGTFGLPLLLDSCQNDPGRTQRGAPDYTLLDDVLAKPVLKRELFTEPVIIDRLQSYFIGKDARNWEELLKEQK